MSESMIPAGISLCTVTFGPPVSFAGRGGKVAVTLTSTHTVIHAATGVQLRSGDDLLETTIDGDNLTFQVPHVDQDGFLDSSGAAVTNWAYTLTGEVKFGKKKISVNRSFQVFVGQDYVDLDLIPTGPVTPGVTAPTAEVLSVAGRTGHVSGAVMVEALEPDLSASFGGSGGSVAGTIPTALGWSADSKYAVTPTLRDAFGAVGVVGDVGVTPEALFGRFSTTLTAPDLELWVNQATGSNSNAGTSSGAPLKGLWKAVELGNANGGKVKVHVAAGTYPRADSLFNTGTPIACDLALIAENGRVVTGNFDTFTVTTPDATHTNCYTVAVANCERVLDTLNPNRYGNHSELVKVSSAALCNTTPGSWFHSAGTLYIHRADKATIAVGNTRVYRTVTNNFLCQSARNLYVGGNGSGYGFDFEGAANNAVVYVTMGATVASQGQKAAVFANCTAKYGGGTSGTAVEGFGSDRWNGLVARFNCSGEANGSDAHNAHNTGDLSPNPFVLTVNCAGIDSGRGTQTSVQTLTAHENVKWIDVASYSLHSRGGAIRNIDTSKMYALGTLLKDDLGDFRVNGGVRPTAVRIDGSAELWAERVKVDMGRGQNAYVTGDGTAKIHRRNCLTVPQPDSGPGVIDTY